MNPTPGVWISVMEVLGGRGITVWGGLYNSESSAF